MFVFIYKWLKKTVLLQWGGRAGDPCDFDAMRAISSNPVEHAGERSERLGCMAINRFEIWDSFSTSAQAIRRN